MAEVDIVPLGFALGAEVRGLDLRRPLTAGQRDAVYAAWLQHLVLVFPRQQLTPEEHVAFSRNFGELDQHDAQPSRYLHPKHREILLVTNRLVDGKPSETRRTGRDWHADMTYTRRPAKGSLLYCQEKPPVGGDTMFANMYLAYETLSPKLRGFLDGLEGVHASGVGKKMRGRDPQQTAELMRRNPPVIHPLVLTHPETGRKSLSAGQRVIEICDLTEEEGEALLRFLNDHAASPEFVYRHRWSVGDLLIWDNRCTQHIALPDFDQTQPRTMLRTTLLGEPEGRLAEDGAANDREALLQARLTAG